MNKFLLIAGAVLAGLSVAAGAFGAHQLQMKLDDQGMKIFHTAVEYQFYHSLALIISGMLSSLINSRLIKISGYLFLSGIILFSGSLYLLSIASLQHWNVPTWMGLLTPFGGLSFISGWIAMVAAIVRHK